MAKQNNRSCFVFLIFLMVLLAGCSADNVKKRYVLAEKLWTSGDYAAAVSEFDQVTRKDPKGKLGLQALFRSAMTQAIFLSKPADAIQKFKTFILLSGNTSESWVAQVQIGDLLFNKMQAYEQAILHYRLLLEKRPDADEAPEFLFKIAKCHFFLWEFNDAIELYKKIQKKYSLSLWAEKAAYEVGVTYYTSGDQETDFVKNGKYLEPYKKAIEAYKEFIAKFPKSEWAPHAEFGIAASLEEMDQLEAAKEKYELIEKIYPSPGVIKIKLTRLDQRIASKKRTGSKGE